MFRVKRAYGGFYFAPFHAVWPRQICRRAVSAAAAPLSAKAAEASFRSRRDFIRIATRHKSPSYRSAVCISIQARNYIAVRNIRSDRYIFNRYLLLNNAGNNRFHFLSDSDNMFVGVIRSRNPLSPSAFKSFVDTAYFKRFKTSAKSLHIFFFKTAFSCIIR